MPQLILRYGMVHAQDWVLYKTVHRPQEHFQKSIISYLWPSTAMPFQIDKTKITNVFIRLIILDSVMDSTNFKLKDLDDNVMEEGYHSN